MLERLKEINNSLIKLNNGNEKELKKQLLIRDILERENCFLKMSIEYAFSILRDLNIKEDYLKTVYLELIKL